MSSRPSPRAARRHRTTRGGRRGAPPETASRACAPRATPAPAAATCRRPRSSAPRGATEGPGASRTSFGHGTSPGAASVSGRPVTTASPPTSGTRPPGSRSSGSASPFVGPSARASAAAAVRRIGATSTATSEPSGRSSHADVGPSFACAGRKLGSDSSISPDRSVLQGDVVGHPVPVRLERLEGPVERDHGEPLGSLPRGASAAGSSGRAGRARRARRSRWRGAGAAGRRAAHRLSRRPTHRPLRRPRHQPERRCRSRSPRPPPRC